MPQYHPPDYADNTDDERQLYTNHNRLVYQAYGLDEDDIRVIEGSFVAKE